MLQELRAEVQMTQGELKAVLHQKALIKTAE